MEDVLESNPGASWIFAREAGHRISQLNDVRILQILDEFQYLNRWIVSDDDVDNVELLCHSYMGAAESIPRRDHRRDRALHRRGL